MIRVLKTVHGWLGILVLPWVLLMGLTGLYLNHSDLVYKFLPAPSYDEAQFDKWPARAPLNEAAARAVAGAAFPGEKLILLSGKTYHGRDVIQFEAETGRAIIATKTGHYWIKTRYKRRTYDPRGRLLDSKVYWDSLFKSLHARGWTTGWLGTTFADITATALVIFGISGIFLFLARLFGRGTDGKAGLGGKIEIARSNVPRPKRIKLKG